MLPRHYASYFKAYCLETVGFWHPYMQADYGYIDIYILDNTVNIHQVDLIDKYFGFSIGDELKSFQPMMGSGTLLWILLISSVLTFKLRNKKMFLFYAPSLFCWTFIMAATPVAFSLRYVYVLALLAPVFLVLPFGDVKTKL